MRRIAHTKAQRRFRRLTRFSCTYIRHRAGRSRLGGMHRLRRWRQPKKPNPLPRVSPGVLASIGLVVAFAGCGGGSQALSNPAAPSTPVAQNVSVTGQYNLVLTSSNGRGTANIYTDFTQTGTTFTGAANTLVCRQMTCHNAKAMILRLFLLLLAER
jgi:hypothetical protein